MVFEGDINEKVVGLAILKKKWEVGHGPMGIRWKFQSDIVGEWLHFESWNNNWEQISVWFEGGVSIQA